MVVPSSWSPARAQGCQNPAFDQELPRAIHTTCPWPLSRRGAPRRASSPSPGWTRRARRPRVLSGPWFLPDPTLFRGERSRGLPRAGVGRRMGPAAPVSPCLPELTRPGTPWMMLLDSGHSSAVLGCLPETSSARARADTSLQVGSSHALCVCLCPVGGDRTILELSLSSLSSCIAFF